MNHPRSVDGLGAKTIRPGSVRSGVVAYYFNTPDGTEPPERGWSTDGAVLPFARPRVHPDLDLGDLAALARMYRENEEGYVLKFYATPDDPRPQRVKQQRRAVVTVEMPELRAAMFKARGVHKHYLTCHDGYNNKTLARLLEKHKHATDDTMVLNLYDELLLAQRRLPSSEITPSLVRRRIADHAALAHAEGLRQAKEALKLLDEDESAGTPEQAEKGMKKLMKSCSARLEGFIKHGEGKADKKDPTTQRKGGTEKIALKSAFHTPRVISVQDYAAGSRYGKKVAFTDPPVAAPEGTGKFIVTRTEMLSPYNENGKYIQYLREPTPVELETADQVGIIEVPLKFIKEVPNGKCAKVTIPEDEYCGSNVLEVRERLAMEWGDEELTAHLAQEEYLIDWAAKNNFPIHWSAKNMKD
ncbi:hypothetical protein EDC01DRAFT_780815 [Geopyxis carbonaria]|nr:hypothetical protein EDC01DRAFT_780815 [Geopyxis carbonaria]